MERMSIVEGEARFGKLAVRPWGEEVPWGYQGVQVGIYTTRTGISTPSQSSRRTA